MDDTAEFCYDRAAENVGRLLRLALAIFGCLLSFLAAWMMVSGYGRVLSSKLGFVQLAMLATGPVLLSSYISHLLRHMRYRSTRIVVHPEGLTLYLPEGVRELARQDIDYISHTGSMLEIRLRNQDPILIPATFVNQADLLARLGV